MRVYAASPDGATAQIMIRPRRTPIVTASVRLPALSLAKIEAMWNLTVWFEMRSRTAMALLPSPSAIKLRISISRAVRA